MQADMIMLQVLLLLQGLLLAAWCDVWQSDQELKDGEGEHAPHQYQGGWDHGDQYGYSGAGHNGAGAQKGNPDISGTVLYPREHEHPSEDLSVDIEGDTAMTHSNKTPTRMGNWCAFVHKRVVTMAVSCGSEKYIIKSQSPCPSGTPDCHLIMYKLSTRPVYREKQKIFTALLWKCCPGHGGENCEDIVENGHVSESEVSSTDTRLHPGGPAQISAGPEKLTSNQNQEQNDHQESRRSLDESLRSEENQTEEQHTSSPHTGHEPHLESSTPHDVDDAYRRPPSETHYPNPGLVPIHYLKDVMMSHLQPIFDSFNLKIARLSEEVQDLQKDMTELQLQQMLQGESKAMSGGISEQSEQHEAMTDNFQELEELHAQQVMLQNNLTNLKTETDDQIKHYQKTLQTSLHSLDSSLSEMRKKQEQMEKELLTVLTLASPTPSPGRELQEDTAVWEAITRLDNKVVNNTVRLNALNEDQVHVTKKIQHLQKGWKTLEESITQNDRKNEDRYIEAFLEVDAAKEAVGKYADDMAKNISILQNTVQELESDTDYLYTQFYNMSSGSRDCDCSGVSRSVEKMQQSLANVTLIASENRLALDRAAEERLNFWENGGWSPELEEIKLGLHTVQNLLALEQEKRKTQQQTLTTLESSLLGFRLDIEALQQQDSQKAVDIKHLFNSFSSLLKDAIRHSDVLELLLGEEVLEFIDKTPQNQKAHSIPTLKMQITDLQEQINRHSQSLASILNSEDPTAGEPLQLADWITEDLIRQEKQRSDHFSEEPTGNNGKHVTALEKSVEQLRAHVVKLEEQRCLSCCDCTKSAASKDKEEKLEAEINSVRKSLDDHLKIFSSVFSNTESLTESEATVDLDKLFAIMKKKEAKRQKKRQTKRGDTTVVQRSKRDTSLQTAVYSQLPENPPVFVASLADSVNTPGRVVFENTSLNRGQTYSPATGTFRAPSAGVYLFVLTLDFGPGPSLVYLKRGEEVAASLYQSSQKTSGPATRVCVLQLQHGEEVQLDLVQGTLEHGTPQDNTFSGLLLLQST